MKSVSERYENKSKDTRNYYDELKDAYNKSFSKYHGLFDVYRIYYKNEYGKRDAVRGKISFSNGWAKISMYYVMFNSNHDYFLMPAKEVYLHEENIIKYESLGKEEVYIDMFNVMNQKNIHCRDDKAYQFIFGDSEDK